MSKKCFAKHAKYQPTDEEWKCPICGADSEYFYIDTPDPEASDECELLHEDDIVCCTQCGNGWTGAEIAEIFLEKQEKHKKDNKKSQKESGSKVKANTNISIQKVTNLLYLLMNNEFPCKKVVDLVNTAVNMSDKDIDNQYVFKFAKDLVNHLK